MNILATIIVMDAALAVAAAGVDLPDDFGTGAAGVAAAGEGADTTFAAVPPVVAGPLLRFELPGQSAGAAAGAAVAGPDDSAGVAPVKPRRILVVASWCRYCPAAKRRWLADGNDAADIVDIDAARALGFAGRSVPVRFTVPAAVVGLGRFAVDDYREQWPPVWTINGVQRYSKTAAVRHLRTSSTHAGQHWQQWDLEAWPVERLAALHDDVHTGRVAVREPPAAEVRAVVSGVSALTVETIGAALSEHLRPDDEPAAAFADLLAVDVSPDLRAALVGLLVAQRLELPAAGVVADWSAESRALNVSAGRIEVVPGVSVAVVRWRVRVSATLTAVEYPPDLSWVRLELVGAPDLTVALE